MIMATYKHKTFFAALRFGLPALLIMTLAACEPTIKIEAPDKPIVMRIDLNIKHEILLKVEKEVDNVSVTPAIPLAKRAGWIGERRDGYLGIVRQDAPKEIRSLLLDANENRQSRYTEIAEKNNTTRDTVETIAGRRFIEKSAPGEYVMDTNEKWVRK